ncbi:efflux RND transporter periplasmic adaptor subunit [Sphingomonas sp. GlSt437]|uniref:efflux RND transporter periplasmic adaptor subunit n=1 Tax=Sphingomonas sp. GlSt437 TaxID=3389970 RepID=UPI003A8412D1
MRLGVVAILGALAAMLAGCSSPTTTTAAPPPPEVRIATIGATDQPASVTGVGTVALRREAQLGFTSAGRILSIAVNEGDRVHAGQVLASLDTTTVRADLARAAAERDRAVAEYKRSAVLMGQGWITRPRLETAKAALEAADAAVAQARFQASHATIVAPGPGVVLSRLTEPGQVVAAGTPVLNVGDEASGYVLRVPLSDRDAARLVMGAPARVTLAALGGATLTGPVIEIGGRADKATGTFIAEIRLPADPRLKSGEIGDATITATGAPDRQLSVPAPAIFAARAGTGFAYVLDPARPIVHLRQVSIGEATDDGIRVLVGLSPGERVVTSRVDRLKDGMTVRVIGPAK